MKKLGIKIIALLSIFSILSTQAVSPFSAGKDYDAGDIVENEGRYYECREEPYTGLCKEGDFYEPGVGIYWQEAWEDVSNSTEIEEDNETNLGGNGYPGTPRITNLPKTYNEGTYTIYWVLSKNAVKGTKVKLEENGNIIAVKTLGTNDDKNRGSFLVEGKRDGVYNYALYLCSTSTLKEVCTKSSKLQITVELGGEQGINDGKDDEEIIYTPLNDEIKRIIASAEIRSGTIIVDEDDIDDNYENVGNVMSIISEEKWYDLFPIADDQYTYENFLKAVARFPAFCGEKGDYTPDNNINVCKKELATLFAHMVYESGLHSKYSSIPLYPSIDNLLPAQQGLYYTRRDLEGETSDYRARGPMMISGLTNYKKLSLSLYSDTRLLDNPEILATNGYLGLSSALWYYMTPQNEKPSMHDVVAGFWTPNSKEIRNSLEQGFSATLNIVDYDICGKGTETKEAEERIEYYSEFAENLGAKKGSSLSCKNAGDFEEDNYELIHYYFTKISTSEKCVITNKETPYYVFDKDAYEACNTSEKEEEIDKDEDLEKSTDNEKEETREKETATKSKRSEIPKFRSLRNQKVLIDYKKVLETRVIQTIYNHKMEKKHIRAMIEKIDSWLDLLKKLNRKGELTGEEKRSFFILRVLKEIFEKYD